MDKLLRILSCILFSGLLTYLYIDRQNDLRTLQMQLPELTKELYALREENIKILYEIERFENPKHLMQLSRDSGYSHLKEPFAQEILALYEGVILPAQNKELIETDKDIPQIVVGASK